LLDVFGCKGPQVTGSAFYLIPRDETISSQVHFQPVYDERRKDSSRWYRPLNSRLNRNGNRGVQSKPLAGHDGQGDCRGHEQSRQTRNLPQAIRTYNEL